MNWGVPILLLGLILLANAQRWPMSGSCAPCKCSLNDRSNERFRNVDCSNLGLEKIPSNLPMDLDILDFGNNNLPSKNVKEIRRFTYLQSLSLANNDITILDDSPFSRSPLLTILTLKGNTITKLTQNAFVGLRNLKGLHGLKIDSAETQVFQHLPLLRELNLTIISSEVSEGIFDGLMVNSLTLTLERASELPHNLFAFGSKTLKNLHLTAPKIKNLHEDLLGGLIFLKSIYLELPSLTHLPESLFSKYLKDDTGNNNKPTNLQEVHLISIERIPSGILSGLEHLVTLVIKHAEELPRRDFFDNLVNLQVLDLSQNFIRRIPVNWFAKLNNLESLILRQASLRKIDVQSFKGLDHLKTLDLSMNSLRSIPKDVFTPVQNTLENLNLNENILKKIEAGSLSGMYSLKTLDLGDNKMSSLESETFTDLIRLSDLNIQENKVSFLPNQLFHSQQRLNKLNLSSNFFNSFPPALLEVSGPLIYLDLSDNQIRDIGHCLSDKFPFMEFLSLELNPLHCNCNISILKASHPNLHLIGMCASPVEFADQHINNISMPNQCLNITCPVDSVSSTPSIKPELITSMEPINLLNKSSDQHSDTATPAYNRSLHRENSTNITTMLTPDTSSIANNLHRETSTKINIMLTPDMSKIVNNLHRETSTKKNMLTSDISNIADDLYPADNNSESYESKEESDENVYKAHNGTKQSPDKGSEKSENIFDRIEFKVVIGIIGGCVFLILFALVVYWKKKKAKKGRFVFSPSVPNNV